MDKYIPTAWDLYCAENELTYEQVIKKEQQKFLRDYYDSVI